MKIHKEGRSIIAWTIVSVVALNALMFSFTEYPWLFYFVAFASLVILILVLQFFRLPYRKNRAGSNELVSPCDGKVVAIEEVTESEYFKDRRIQLSIFMSPLNVHANWTPCQGEVSYVKYHEGLYLVAWHPKSSTDNERNTVVIRAGNGKSVLLRQIAGAVARRIVCYVKAGDKVVSDQQFGFIKFGSRVDVLLPLGTEMNVKIGDLTKGNETVIARW